LPSIADSDMMALRSAATKAPSAGVSVQTSSRDDSSYSPVLLNSQWVLVKPASKAPLAVHGGLVMHRASSRTAPNYTSLRPARRTLQRPLQQRLPSRWQLQPRTNSTAVCMMVGTAAATVRQSSQVLLQAGGGGLPPAKKPMGSGSCTAGGTGGCKLLSEPGNSAGRSADRRPRGVQCEAPLLMPFLSAVQVSWHHSALLSPHLSAIRLCTAPPHPAALAVCHTDARGSAMPTAVPSHPLHPTHICPS
jgi:hypothetical protein